MSPSRRQVVASLAAAGVAPASVVSAQDDGNSTDNESQDGTPEGTPEDGDGAENESQEDTPEETPEDEEDGEFSPEISFYPNNLVARIGEREDGSDPDTVTVYTADGSVFEFDGRAENERDQGKAFDVGYTRSDSRGKISGWHGLVERVEATKGDKTVSRDNDAESSLEVSCTLWKTPDYPPTEFTVISDGATKHHWNRGEQDLSEDQRQYGSKGRRLQTVVEHNPEGEMRVDFGDRGCYPEERKSCYFECTSVTVEREELNQGEDRIEDVQLRFADGTYENPEGDADEADNGAFELPVTLEGSGENEGKIIENLHFKVPHGEYYYRNLDVEECRRQAAEDGSGEESAEGSSEGSDDGQDATPEDDGSDGETDDGSGSGDGGDGDGPAPDGSADDSGTTTGNGDGTSDGSAETEDGGPSSQETTETPGGSTDRPSDGPTADHGATETPSGEADGTATQETGAPPSDDSTATSTPGDGATETPESGTDGSAPGLPDDGPADEQPGMGVVAALGGLLGFGELARRRLGDDERPADRE
jgi:hypothetical protein